jgi:hypothetical protein
VLIFFGPVKVLPLLDQMSSEVQGTFGMTVKNMSTKHNKYAANQKL